MSACFVDYKATWLDRLRWKLFPVEFCEIPDIPARDCVITRTECRFSIGGRLRVLLSGRVMVETKTATEHVVGSCSTASCCYVQAPQIMERKERGAA